MRPRCSIVNFTRIYDYRVSYIFSNVNAKGIREIRFVFSCRYDALKISEWSFAVAVHLLSFMQPCLLCVFLSSMWKFTKSTCRIESCFQIIHSSSSESEKRQSISDKQQAMTDRVKWKFNSRVQTRVAWESRFLVTCTSVGNALSLFTASHLCEMCRTSEYVQLRLLSFYKSNVKIAQLVRELFSAEGIKIDRKTVAKYYKRFKRDLLSVTCRVAGDRQHLKGDTLISSIRSWNKTMS